MEDKLLNCILHPRFSRMIKSYLPSTKYIRSNLILEFTDVLSLNGQNWVKISYQVVFNHGINMLVDLLHITLLNYEHTWSNIFEFNHDDGYCRPLRQSFILLAMSLARLCYYTSHKWFIWCFVCCIKHSFFPLSCSQQCLDHSKKVSILSVNGLLGSEPKPWRFDWKNIIVWLGLVEFFKILMRFSYVGVWSSMVTNFVKKVFVVLLFEDTRLGLLSVYGQNKCLWPGSYLACMTT